MPERLRFPYGDRGASRMPFLPLTLSRGASSVDVLGLVDSGAAVNVLPFEMGMQLGAVWEEQTTHVLLTGNLARAEARALLVTARVGSIGEVLMAFAWTKLNSVPLILGQMNFFLEFSICFFRYESFFEVTRR